LQFDPIFNWALQTGLPSDWSKVGKAAGTTMAQRIMDEAKDFGLNNGWVIPLHQINGYRAVLSTCGEQVEQDPELFPLLHMLVVFAHGKVPNICSKKGPENSLSVLQHPAVLTRRGMSMLGCCRKIELGDWRDSNHQ
jgi:hypothetical protein